MERSESSENKLTPENSRSFNRFLVIVILVMLVTGFLALWDNWGGDIIERTGKDETKKLALPNEVTVILMPESQISFQKGSAHKILFSGSADIEIAQGSVTREISFETADATAKTKEARYHLEADASGTQIRVDAGQVHFVLKPISAGALFLHQGETYQYKIEDTD